MKYRPRPNKTSKTFTERIHGEIKINPDFAARLQKQLTGQR